MQDSGNYLGGLSVTFLPFSQCFLKNSMFCPLCCIGRGVTYLHSYVHIFLGIRRWAILPLFYSSTCRQWYGGQSGRSYLSGPGSSICRKLKIVPVYNVVVVLIEDGYLVPV